MAADFSFRLRSLPLAARLSLTFLMIVCIGGYVASAAHMQTHHENRDERSGLSLTDLQGAYHGVTRPAALGVALERNHPGELAGQQPLDEVTRGVLLDWLGGDPDQIVPNWDNLDLGDAVPADLLDEHCVSCHSRSAPEALRAAPFLEYLDDVRAVAFSRNISPTDMKLLLASTHAHSLALATITLIICALGYATALPGRLKGILCLLASGGLALDLAAWWLARDAGGFVYVIVAGGLAHGGAMVILMLGITAELWRLGARS